MSRYKPTSRAVPILRHLADHGPASFAELLALVQHSENRRRRKLKVRGILRALDADGFVTMTGGLYVVTPAGLDALAVLEAGHAVETAPTTYFRTFERAA